MMAIREIKEEAKRMISKELDEDFVNYIGRVYQFRVEFNRKRAEVLL